MRELQVPEVIELPALVEVLFRCRRGQFTARESLKHRGSSASGYERHGDFDVSLSDLSKFA